MFFNVTLNNQNSKPKTNSLKVCNTTLSCPKSLKITKSKISPDSLTAPTFRQKGRLGQNFSKGGSRSRHDGPTLFSGDIFNAFVFVFFGSICLSEGKENLSISSDSK